MKMMKRKVCAAVIMLCMLLQLFPAGIWAAPASSFGGGSGAENDPYLISSVEELEKLAADVNAGNNYSETFFELTANLDLAEQNWTPIGNSSYPFKGNFDGGNHIIYNMTINTSTRYCGLFGKLQNATIQNLGIENANVTSSANDVAALAGNAQGGAISRCYVTGTVKGKGAVSGILGSTHSSAYTTQISDCYARIAIIENGTYTDDLAGISGWNEATSVEITNCYSACTGEIRPIAGWSDGSAVSNSQFVNTFFDITLSPNFSSSSGRVDLGKTSDELKTQATYTGWDFASVWAIDSALNGGYPYLQGFTPGVGGAPGSITVTLTDEDNNPVTNADVSLFPTGSTNAEEEVTLSHVGNGVYSGIVTTSDETYDVYVDGTKVDGASITQDGTSASAGTVMVPSGQPPVTSHTHCLCGKADCTDSAHQEITYQQWDNGYITENVSGSITSYTLEAGNYYLTESVTLTQPKAIGIKGTVNLCLNGFDITSENNLFELQDSGVLNICDCKETGELSTTGSGATIRFAQPSASRLNVYSGTVTSAGDYAVTPHVGSATYIYGGKVSAADGDGIQAFGGDVYVCGGVVEGGAAGISLMRNTSRDANITVSGGVVKGGAHSICYNSNPSPVGSLFVTIEDGADIQGKLELIKGSLNMTGGSITGSVLLENTAAVISGGAVAGTADAITVKSGGSLALSGNPVITAPSGFVSLNIAQCGADADSAPVQAEYDGVNYGGEPLTIMVGSGAAVGQYVVNGVADISVAEKFTLQSDDFRFAYDANALKLAVKQAEAGPFIVMGGTDGTDFAYDNVNKVLNILTSTPLKITAKQNPVTYANIAVAGDVNADVTIKDLQIDLKDCNGSALIVPDGSKLTLAVEGTNLLRSYAAGPGILVEDGAALVVDGSDTDALEVHGARMEHYSEGDGASGGLASGFAGIGGQNHSNAHTYTGEITINGGKIDAHGYGYGTGIGGGDFSSGGTITINGGIITATVGIGEPEGWGDFTSAQASGIGASQGQASGKITISGGTIIAHGGYGCAGIGGGTTDVSISGGTVTAYGGSYAAGIGGYDQNKGDINIMIGASATVTAYGGSSASAIGQGANTTAAVNLKIENGATVAAFSKEGSNRPAITATENTANDPANLINAYITNMTLPADVPITAALDGETKSLTVPRGSAGAAFTTGGNGEYIARTAVAIGGITYQFIREDESKATVTSGTELTMEKVKAVAAADFAKEPTPQAKADYENNRLTNLVPDAKYRLEIPGFYLEFTAESDGTFTDSCFPQFYGAQISIVKIGNGTNTLKSDPQLLQTVKPAVTGVTVKTQANKTSYEVGDSVDYTGLSVTLSYAAGEQTYSRDFALADFAANGIGIAPAAGSVLNVAGTVTATLTAGALSTSFDLTVSKKQQDSLVIGGVPQSVTYGDAGFALHISGGTGVGALSYQITNGNSVSVDTNGNVSVLSAGVSTITVTKASDNTYHSETATVNITVAPRAVAIAWSGTEGLVYNGAKKTVTATVSNKVGADVIHLTVTDNVKTNAGNYTAAVTAVDNANYTVENGLNLTKDWSIAKAAAVDPGTPAPAAVVYNPQSTLASVALDTGWVWTDSTVLPVVNNNGYIAYYAIADDENYDWTNISGYDAAAHRLERTIDLIVDPATPSYSVPAGLTATYGQTLADINGLTNGFTWQDAPTSSVGNAGNHSFKAIFTPEDTVNYITVRDIDVPVTVTRAASSMTLNTENPQGVGENRSVELMANITGVTGGEVPTGTVKFYNGETAISNDVAVDVDGKAFFTWNNVPVGTHSLKAVYSGSGNYLSKDASASYSLDKDTQTALAVAEVPSKTYGDEPFALEITGGSGTGAFRYSIAGESIVYDEATNKFIIVKTGDSTITVTKLGDDNYNETTAAVTIHVSQKTPTLDTAPTASRIRRDNMLSTSALSGGVVTGLDGTTALEGTWTWKNDREMTEAGDFKETALFTPDDTNYAVIEVSDISVTVYRPSSGGGTTRYSVAFDSRGGSKVSIQMVNRNTAIAQPEDPTREGYTFEGWFTDRNCTKAYNFSSVVTKNTTLYAKWAEDKKEPTEPVQPDKWVNPFTDVKENDWFYRAVQYAEENGLFSGITANSFEPDTAITRGMMVTVLYRAEGEPEVTALNSFLDVDADAYYAKAVAWALNNGIVKGYSADKFAPDKLISREELSAVMNRYAAYKSVDITAAGELERFSDQSQIADWARGNVKWAVGFGLLIGKDNYRLDPQGNTTRAEAAAILMRFLEK